MTTKCKQHPQGATNYRGECILCRMIAAERAQAAAGQLVVQRFTLEADRRIVGETQTGELIQAWEAIEEHCRHCGSTDNHPAEARDICPTYEAYVADVQSGAIAPSRGSYSDHASEFPETADA